MIEGVTILNQSIVMEAVDWYIPVIIICGVLAAICFTVAMDSYNDVVQGFGVIFGILFVLVLFIVGCWEPQQETDRYQYEVTVGDYVRFTDIYEKYDVVERRGEIWVLEDKDD